MKSHDWDYIIVGGGTAGCVMAARLTEQHGLRVLLLEAGGEYSKILSVPLVGLRKTTALSWKYFTTQQRGLAQRRISFPFGKLLGGSSSTNGMMYYRGTRNSYERWRELGNPGWSFASLLPYFRKCETWERGASEFHGDSGPVHVSMPRHQAPFSKAFVDACIEQGISYTDDFNGPQDEGAGYFPVMQQSGRRMGAASAYLAPARGRSDLHVETGSVARKLLVEGSRAIGVEFQDREGQVQSAFASREVILSAGPLNSPKLLMLSGIGPADYIHHLGVQLHHHLPGVGSNLIDRLRLPVLYESKQRSPGHMIYWIPAALNYAVRRKGVLTSNCCESGAVVRSHPGVKVADLQFVTHFQSPLSPDAVDFQFCFRGSSVPGTVRASSTDPMAPPLIDPNYLGSDADLEVAVRGIHLAREIAQSAARRFPLGEEILPGRHVTTNDEMKEYCRAMADTCFHAVGTCRMGPDSMAVVNDQLRVHGMENLRVVDASIMPDVPNGNTCAAVLMIAEKGADLVTQASSGNSTFHLEPVVNTPRKDQR
jgi:choline dehydrogenase-like flavoprotein